VELPGRGIHHRRRGNGAAGGALLLVAAAPAARRFVLKSAVLVETLLPSREDELFTTVATFDYLVHVRHAASETRSPDETKTPPTGEYRGGPLREPWAIGVRKRNGSWGGHCIPLVAADTPPSTDRLSLATVNYSERRYLCQVL